MYENQHVQGAVRFEAGSIYDESAVRTALGLTEHALRRGRSREGLRSSRRGRKRFYRGEWILAWLSGGVAVPDQSGIRREAAHVS